MFSSITFIIILLLNYIIFLPQLKPHITPCEVFYFPVTKQFDLSEKCTIKKDKQLFNCLSSFLYSFFIKELLDNSNKASKKQYPYPLYTLIL